MNTSLGTLPNPDNVRYPPNIHWFTFTHSGRTLPVDTPKRIQELVKDSLWRNAAKKEEHDYVHRMLDSINLTAQNIGRRGSNRYLCSRKGAAQPRWCYMHEEYFKLMLEFGTLPNHDENNEIRKDFSTLFPWCKNETGNAGPKGNMRHMHMYCQYEPLLNTREVVNIILEKLLADFAVQGMILKERDGLRSDITAEINTTMCVLSAKNCVIGLELRYLIVLQVSMPELRDYGDSKDMMTS